MKTLVVLSGCPAAGKSSLSQTLKQHVHAAVLEIDCLLKALGEFSVEKLRSSRNTVLQQAEDLLLNSDYDYVVVDDTNHLKQQVKAYKRLSERCQCKFLHLVIKVTLAEALHRNSTRDAPVEDAVLTDIHNTVYSQRFFKHTVQLEHPTENELLQALQKASCIVRQVHQTQAPSQEQTAELCLRRHIAALMQNCPLDRKPVLARACAAAKKQALAASRGQVASDLLAKFDELLVVVENCVPR